MECAEGLCLIRSCSWLILWKITTHFKSLVINSYSNYAPENLWCRTIIFLLPSAPANTQGTQSVETTTTTTTATTQGSTSDAGTMTPTTQPSTELPTTTTTTATTQGSTADTGTKPPMTQPPTELPTAPAELPAELITAPRAQLTTKPPAELTTPTQDSPIEPLSAATSNISTSTTITVIVPESGNGTNHHNNCMLAPRLSLYLS